MSNQKNQTPNDNGIIREKLKKVAELKELGIEPYGRNYDKVNDIAEINKYDETCDKVFKTAGRIVGFRRMGKNGFGKLQDPTGQIQYYVKKEEVGEDQYEIYKKLGLGDFLGVEGSLFRTKTGELTLRVKSFEVLSKNVRPLPEKFHGLTNVETRYRQRYVDLVIPETSWEQKKTDVKEYHIDTFVMGDDWKGKFDYLEEEGVEVVYLPRTKEISTTKIKEDLSE